MVDDPRRADEVEPAVGEPAEAEVSEAELAAAEELESAEVIGAEEAAEAEVLGAELAEAEATDVEPADADPAGERRVPMWAQWGILAAAVVVLVTGVLAWRGAGSDELDRAEHRDRALIEGRRLVETMQTMDPRDLEEHLDRWRDATTGVLHDQLENISDDDREVLLDQEKRSTARVVDAALTRLGEDTAVMLAAVEVTTTDNADPDAEPVVKRNRFAADLVKRDGSWKLENLQQVAVNVS